MRWVQPAVAHYDGTLIDLNIGDEGSYLYINFGAPQAHENDAERAATTVLALRTPPPASQTPLPGLRSGLSAVELTTKGPAATARSMTDTNEAASSPTNKTSQTD